ncbi:MAG TPA: D-aminoacyl-tRNA deacylase [Gudongella oleilytica]|jgi:D-tyrosyl-tRNA(Tyr) deacylase|nr:D-aminoacyl-tRNA deacylase [Gudongella oleilytica]
MRAVVQRVSSAEVRVDDKMVGRVGKGLLVYLGVGKEDTVSDIEYMAEKVSGLRIFEDENGKMNLSVQDIEGEILAISQFTLYGDVRKGKRPSFSDSAAPDKGEELYNQFIRRIQGIGIRIEKGIFGAHMMVDYVNDGPVTILLDSKKQF